jgi:hypothetical protein
MMGCRGKFGEAGARVFNLLAGGGQQLEQRTVSERAMLPLKLARELLYRMLKARYVSLQVGALCAWTIILALLMASESDSHGTQCMQGFVCRIVHWVCRQLTASSGFVRCSPHRIPEFCSNLKEQLRSSAPV